MLNVLLTNDDGIEAEGLQALRRALAALDGVRLAVIAPDGNRSAMAVDHDAQAAVGAGGPVRGWNRRLRDRRYAGGLRAPREPRLVEDFATDLVSPGSTTARTSAMTSPIRDGRGGARGRRAGDPRDRGLPTVSRAGTRLPLRRRLLFELAAGSSPRSSSGSRTCRCRRARF